MGSINEKIKSKINRNRNRQIITHNKMHQQTLHPQYLCTSLVVGMGTGFCHTSSHLQGSISLEDL